MSREQGSQGLVSSGRHQSMIGSSQRAKQESSCFLCLLTLLENQTSPSEEVSGWCYVPSTNFLRRLLDHSRMLEASY
jgi:hypothetical protein